MSVYDQRMSSSSNIYYFQLVPFELVSLSDDPHPQALIFKLFKNKHLCDSSKKPIEVIVRGKQLKISKAFINFNISAGDIQKNPEINLFIQSQNMEQDNSYINRLKDIDLSSDQNNKQNQINVNVTEKVGSCEIQINKIIEQFNEGRKRFFLQKYQISQNYVLIFNVYIQRSRFALQKYVRAIRDKQKYQNKKNVDNPFFNSQQNIQSHTQLEGKKHNKKQEPNIILKPFRSLTKNTDLSLKKSQHLSNNYLTIEQQSAESRSKSLNNNDNGQIDKQFQQKKEEVEQQMINSIDGIQEDPLKDLVEEINYFNQQQIIEQIYFGDHEQGPLFQMTKSDIQRQRPKQRIVQKQKKKVKKYQKEKKIVKNQAKILKKQTKVEVEKKKVNLPTQNALVIALSIFMFFIMIRVMVPSRRV